MVALAHNVSQIAVRFNDGYVLLPAGTVNLAGVFNWKNFSLTMFNRSMSVVLAANVWRLCVRAGLTVQK